MSLLISSANGKIWSFSDLQEKTSLSLSKSAPIWVRDGIKEMISQGISQKEAFKALQNSPFFNNDWLSD